MTLASQHQPPPEPGAIEVGPIVLRDIQERIDAGYVKYKTKLMTGNGRDALWDAYQEAIDLVMYLRQAILEREAANAIPEHPDMQCGSCGDKLTWDAERGYQHCGPFTDRHEHTPWGVKLWSER